LYSTVSSTVLTCHCTGAAAGPQSPLGPPPAMTLVSLPIVGGVLAWEALYTLSRLALRRAAKFDGVLLNGADAEKLVKQGPSYAIAFVHACLVGVAGLVHVCTLLDAPAEAKIAIPDDSSPWHVAATATEYTNVAFLSWLLYDLGHIIMSYPELGGADTVAHHLGFIAASLICGKYAILAFPFAWLTTGELSSIALNIRWFLINTGRGDSGALRQAQLLFALLFLVTRVVVYGLGLAHLAIHRDVLLSAGRPGSVLAGVPPPLLWAVLVLLVGGYGLNLVWMRKIIRMATKPRKKEGKKGKKE